MSAMGPVPNSLRERQQRASDPGVSAWVSANAGSGKTHVLTLRVLRLLLDGAPPAQILGLTFTKAAAANMADRIYKMLAEWARLDEDKLAKEIRALRPGDVGPDELLAARRLFARAIETPGGLKIQTLHAFCERLLKLFPFEANVPARFRVVDERDAKLLMGEARDRALAALPVSASGAAAVDLAAREAGAASRFDDLLAEAQNFADVFAAFGGPESYAEALRIRLGLPPGVTAARVEAEMLGGEAGGKRREEWATALESGSKNDRTLAACLGEVEDGEDSDRVDALLRVFFVDDGAGAPRGCEGRPMITKGLAKSAPALVAELRAEQDRLAPLRELRRAAKTLERSVALFTVAKAALAAYERTKASRGELDFPDQIARALALVTRSSAAWVMRKLDYALDHLLVDEAQDTSASQWAIMEALTTEFFAGEGARGRKRTVFAVGDEKQSIFSFQGAAPEQFSQMRSRFAKRSREAELPFINVPLNFSFRSAQAILDAVDRTFDSEDAREGLTAEDEAPPRHEAVRKELTGLVELWPPISARAKTPPADWRMPLDAVPPDAPAATLARRIAEVIAGWLAPASPERVADSDGGLRAIRPGDVMILVRTRNAFFEAVIRALKDRNVDVEGADRLKLRDHIAVMDLIAAGRAALLPDDDLTLACALKSPLLGLDDDELFAIASRRTGPLWRALAACETERARAANRRLMRWREAAETLSPYDFYARLLGEDGGRTALLARLGPDAKEPIDEFLALALTHERREAPSMQAFLAEIEADDAEIKRDMETDAKGVRVLTVHASKGLEAPIVFLPDTCEAPDGRRDPRLFRLDSPAPGGPALFAWARKAAEDCGAVARARAARRVAERGEHRRLLYVAMTRAAQRLIVAGYETSRSRKPDCWYNFIERGLAGAAAAPAPWKGGATILKLGEGLRAESAAEMKPSAPKEAFPGWLTARAAGELAHPPLRPSRIGVRRDGTEEKLTQGRLVHALLMSLPLLAPERRAEAARAYLDANGPGFGVAARAEIAAKALRVMEAPQTRGLFGPGSRAEVALAGILRRDGGADLPFQGRLDRLLVTGEAVTIADFKLGAAPLRHAPGHVAQLALYREALRPLYPRLPLRAALVYLDGPTRFDLPDAELDEALAALGLQPDFSRI